MSNKTPLLDEVLKYKKEENIFKVLKDINDTYITNKVSVDINVNPLNLI